MFLRVKFVIKYIWMLLVGNAFNIGITVTFAIIFLALANQYTSLLDIKHSHTADMLAVKQQLLLKDRKILNLERRMSEKLNESEQAIHARIDVVDDTINVEEKRRALVEKIRNAILESTHSSIGIRDLNRIANATIDYSYQYNLTIPQVLAQIQTESNFNSRAVSEAGAKGLMQIMPNTLKYIQYEIDDGPRSLNAFNIYHNIKAGCFYISEQMEDFGSYELALQAYNYGPDRLRKYLAGEIEILPKETQDYVPLIMGRVEFFKGYGLE